MVFKCQENSFLKEYTSKVVSCEKCDISSVVDGKSDCYEVICEDTILFPEGGGQPSDHGFINGKPVLQVKRRGDKAVHYLAEPLNIGDEVLQLIDWERRFDHMQQHSGQHLLSAVLQREYNYDSVSWWLGEDVCHVELVSWWLGEDVCHVELDTPMITVEQINHSEKLVNQFIREARPVTIEVISKDTPEEQLKEARSSRGLPDDHIGDIRIINIKDIDSNMCCGTHITNLSQLQVIKLLHSERSKRKDQILLYFLVGNRVLNRLNTCIEREQKLTVLLKSNPSEHPDLVDKLQKNVKLLSKNLQTLLKDLATLEGKNLKSILPRPKYFFLHRKEAEADFMNVFIRELGVTDIFLFLSTGDEKTLGNIVLYGDEKAVSELGKKICDLLEGKGAGKGNKYQARVTKMANRKKAEQLIAEYFK